MAEVQIGDTQRLIVSCPDVQETAARSDPWDVAVPSIGGLRPVRIQLKSRSQRDFLATNHQKRISPAIAGGNNSCVWFLSFCRSNGSFWTLCVTYVRLFSDSLEVSSIRQRQSWMDFDISSTQGLVRDLWEGCPQCLTRWPLHTVRWILICSG